MISISGSLLKKSPMLSAVTSVPPTVTRLNVMPETAPPGDITEISDFGLHSEAYETFSSRTPETKPAP